MILTFGMLYNYKKNILRNYLFKDFREIYKFGYFIYSFVLYGYGGELSTQGDMYGYGVLLLKMFTGKIPTNNIFIDNISLHSYVFQTK